MAALLKLWFRVSSITQPLCSEPSGLSSSITLLIVPGMLLHLVISYAHALFLPYLSMMSPSVSLPSHLRHMDVPQAVPASLHLIYVPPPCTRFLDAVLSEPSLVVLCVSPSIIVIQLFLQQRYRSLHTSTTNENNGMGVHLCPPFVARTRLPCDVIRIFDIPSIQTIVAAENL